ncbi:MAG TPA: alpha/beta fold hydrolase [Thermomicrobiaceae bacterium]|nr:alpha/beta fold hydrolase [Thermomicrobiaceae bacterium]
MATFVLVPGAWLGGWCWRRLTPLLRDAGHEVYPVTLTGLGERAHLGTPETGLDTFTQDVVGVIESEELDDVILLGHSASGLVAAAVANSIPERVQRIVYLAANIPTNGEPMMGGNWKKQALEEARASGIPWRWPIWDDLSEDGPDLSPEDVAWIRRHAVGHPLKVLFDPVPWDNPKALALPHSYIHCTLEMGPWDEVKSDPAGWDLREIKSGHWPMASAPNELAAVLNAIAG